ncbi:MAG: NADH-quinone oxidoreductase subunit C [Chloroflexi bacterium]|nr:MAG: NADH-quinone oxidoreductase subunit C [Chloroflexota bacterium]
MSTGTTPNAAARPVAGARAAQLLAAKMPDAVLRRDEAFGEETVYLRAERLVDACTLLRDDPEGRYEMAVFVTAVDWPDREPEEPRFDVVYQLRSLEHNDICRLVVQAPEENPTVPTLEGVFAGMDWLERETYDLLGIIFEGHHELRRLLLPDDWVGHPLRKDYVSFGEPVAFTHNLEWALPAQERPPGMPGSTR